MHDTFERSRFLSDVFFFVNIKWHWMFINGGTCSVTLRLSRPKYRRREVVFDRTTGINMTYSIQPRVRLRVYSDWTHVRHFDVLKHDALVLEPMFYQSEHSHRTRHVIIFIQ